ncbi:MAG: hypothetical protein LBC71_03105 [Oscillospiraceae bacterium]|jgi:hypothetical protein|nr:hypothetical protein [Oscillospiraceae bacterium]
MGIIKICERFSGVELETVIEIEDKSEHCLSEASLRSSRNEIYSIFLRSD